MKRAKFKSHRGSLSCTQSQTTEHSTKPLKQLGIILDLYHVTHVHSCLEFVIPIKMTTASLVESQWFLNLLSNQACGANDPAQACLRENSRTTDSDAKLFRVLGVKANICFK